MKKTMDNNTETWPVGCLLCVFLLGASVQSSGCNVRGSAFRSFFGLVVVVWFVFGLGLWFQCGWKDCEPTSGFQRSSSGNICYNLNSSYYSALFPKQDSTGSSNGCGRAIFNSVT